MGEQQSSLYKDIRDIVIYMLVLVTVLLLIHTFVGEQVRVRGASMENTLHQNERLILEKISYNLGHPKRFDIIVFHPKDTPKDTHYIKRIIGLPGEKVQIIDSTIYINGEVLEEDYGKEIISDSGIASDEILLGEDEYFVLGDNRNNSTDSRSSSVGTVTRDSITGKAWVRVYPFNKFGVIDHQ